MECVGFKPVVYVLAEMLGNKGFWFLAINVVDSVIKEVCVVVDRYYVKWCGWGMFW